MSLVEAFTHLKDRPKSEQALRLLQRVASLVKPIMRNRNWKLPLLAEFFPDNDNLVGLNVNMGEKIMLRLRPAWRPDTFYEEDQIVGTMLHELTHNVHSPHDEKFYKLLSELEAEYDALQRSGYAGEGFDSAGRRLGVGVSHNIPPHLARAKALEAAERRRNLNGVLGSGGRLGGKPLSAGGHVKSPRELAAEAAERRIRDEESCGTTKGVDVQREATESAKPRIKDQVEIIDLTSGDEFDGKASSNARATGHRKQGSRGTMPSNSHQPSSVQPKPSYQPTAPEWACKRCTLLNPRVNFQCAACLSSRPEDGSDGWTCGICGETGIDHNFWSCRFCGSIKSGSN